MFDTKYDKHLDEFQIYRKYPQLKPAIGKKFSRRQNKVLIIGESHYLPKDSKIHLSSTEWYNSDSTMLSQIEKDWINIRNTLNNWLSNNAKSKAYSIYNNLKVAASEINGYVKPGESIFDYVTFMNYYLRPAKTGISIKRDDTDKQKSFDNLVSICELTGTRNILFVSRIAYWDFEWFLKNRNPKNIQIEIESIPHPSSSWWNRKSKHYLNSKNEIVTGKYLFIDRIKRIESIT